MSFERLALPIRKYIREKGWHRFHPIQLAAFERILDTDFHYILASKTASGKTEAAFLPVLSQLVEERQNARITAKTSLAGAGVIPAPGDNRAMMPGLRVLYISPLIALINDQVERVEDLCRGLDIPITRWHGEADREQKKKLLADPQGILLITPESIESLFINHTAELDSLFGQLRFIIVDEIHSFLGTPRGCQLQSLLQRIKTRNTGNTGITGKTGNNGNNEKHGITGEHLDTANREEERKLRFIGLSATLGDFEAARGFFGEAEHTRILRDRSSGEVEVSFRYFENTGSSRMLPGDLILDLYRETMAKKSLIFPNSRGKVEELAVKLKKVVQRTGDFQHYFAHHSSISKELREYAEHFAKHRFKDSFGIICTSTLELGIDIGQVDLVVQVDSTFSVSSLVQRFGRSGRRPGEKSRLLVYAQQPWSLLQSLACLALFREGFIEPVVPVRYPIDILFQQLLSIIKETGGAKRDDLLERITLNHAFQAIPSEDIQHLIDYMTAVDYFEDLHGELIIGYEAGKIVHHRSFYSVFQVESSYRVIFRDRLIGELTSSFHLQKDQNIYLAARMWKIIDIDDSKMEIIVKEAEDGKRPVFTGSSGEVHPRVREKMWEILQDTALPADCDEAAQLALSGLREEFGTTPGSGTRAGSGSLNARPVKMAGVRSEFFTFTGTRINRTLELLFKTLYTGDFWYDEMKSSFHLPLAAEKAAYRVLFSDLNKLISGTHFEVLLEKAIGRSNSAFAVGKWGEYLPKEFKKKMLLLDYFDVPGTRDFLNRVETRILESGS